jgi:hypothetical protein
MKMFQDPQVVQQREAEMKGLMVGLSVHDSFFNSVFILFSHSCSTLCSNPSASGRIEAHL